jgi:hypothetical protein
VLVSSLDLGAKLAEKYLANVGTLEQVAERRGWHGEFHEAPVNLLLINSAISSKLTVAPAATGCVYAVNHPFPAIFRLQAHGADTVADEGGDDQPLGRRRPSGPST